MIDEESWIGVDLDGTLAEYVEWRGEQHIGAPVPLMLDRVKKWIADGIRVKIFTARANHTEYLPYIKAWMEVNGLPELEITSVKDFTMIELWDDRCVQVEKNTGKRIDGKD